MTAIDWPRMMLSAIFVLGLLAAVLWWLKRRQAPWSQHDQGRRIRLIETQPLGLKHKMMLVQVDQQMVLVAVNANDIRTLHSWPCSANGPDGPATPAVSTTPSSFPDIVAGGRS